MTLTIEDYYLTILIGTVLPIITALIVKRWSDSHYGAIVLLLLSAISGTLSSIQNAGGTFELRDTLVATVLTFVTASATHYGLLKPIHVTGSAGVVQAAVPGGIVGQSKTEEPLELEY